MIAPTVRPDPLVIVDVALGLGLMRYAAGQDPGVRRWVLSFLGGLLAWSGVLAALRSPTAADNG